MKTEHAQVASIIRKELRRLGITGTVKSRVGAVNVSAWNISPVVVRELESFCSRYQMGHFDPTDDSYRHDSRDDSIPQVPYVFVTTHVGDDLADRIALYCVRTFPGMDGSSYHMRPGAYIPEMQCYTGQLIRHVYDGRVGDFWPAQLR